MPNKVGGPATGKTSLQKFEAEKPDEVVILARISLVELGTGGTRHGCTRRRDLKRQRAI